MKTELHLQNNEDYLIKCRRYLPCSQTQNWHTAAIIQLYVPGHLSVLYRVHFIKEEEQKEKSSTNFDQFPLPFFSPFKCFCCVNFLPLSLLILHECFSRQLVLHRHSFSFFLISPKVSHCSKVFTTIFE